MRRKDERITERITDRSKIAVITRTSANAQRPPLVTLLLVISSVACEPGG